MSQRGSRMNAVMRLATILLGLVCCSAWAAAADYRLAEAGWALTAEFPIEPKPDDFRNTTDYGDEVTHRYYIEQGPLRFMMAKFVYPIVPLSNEQESLYDTSIEQLMKSRPGAIKLKEPFQLGAYTGSRILIVQPREKTLREVRLVLIGASLYVISAEWPATQKSVTPAPECDRFLRSITVRPEFADPRVAEENERWREVGLGRFKLRYDGTRWYRDPSDKEAGVFNFLRVDKQAEAQLIAENEPLQSGTMEESVLATARESAESVVVRKRGKKNRSGATLEELEFAVRTEGVTYVNHGYFYTGAAGALQLRGWAVEKGYSGVATDITEFLDGLVITGSTASGKSAAATR